MKLNALGTGLAVLMNAEAADFENLTFNQPNFANLHRDPVKGQIAPVEELLRGWTVSLRRPTGDWFKFSGEVEFRPLGFSRGPLALNTGLHPDPGDYSVFLGDYRLDGGPNGSQLADIRLTISGSVPIKARTLEWGDFSSLAVSVSDGATRVTGKPQDKRIDIAQFAGRPVEISFVYNADSRGGILDVIGFTLVPEPGSASLLLAGGILILVINRMGLREKSPFE